MARTHAPKTSAQTNIIRLKVTLRGVKPPVWRRLLMPGTTTLNQLHTAIQAAMGWRDCHLHVFDIGGEPFGDRRSVDDVGDEKRPTLNGLLRSSVVRFGYTYDFGDHWEHTIAFEKSEPPVDGRSYLPVSAGSATVRQKIAAVRGVMSTYWPPWPIPTTPNTQTNLTGSAKSSTRTSSNPNGPMQRWLLGSENRRLIGYTTATHRWGEQLQGTTLSSGPRCYGPSRTVSCMIGPKENGFAAGQGYTCHRVRRAAPDR